MPVGLGGGQKGDTVKPQALVLFGPTGPAFVESPIVRGISSYRTIVFYVDVTTAGQVQLRVNWYRDEGIAGDPYQAVRRDAAQNLVADEPTLPNVAGLARFAIPVANPGGATGVSIGVKAAVGTPNVAVWYSAES